MKDAEQIAGLLADEQLFSKACDGCGSLNARLFNDKRSGRYFLEIRVGGRVHTWSAGSLSKLRARVSRGMRHAF